MPALGKFSCVLYQPMVFAITHLSLSRWYFHSDIYTRHTASFNYTCSGPLFIFASLLKNTSTWTEFSIVRQTHRGKPYTIIRPIYSRHDLQDFPYLPAVSRILANKPIEPAYSPQQPKNHPELIN